MDRESRGNEHHPMKSLPTGGRERGALDQAAQREQRSILQRRIPDQPAATEGLAWLIMRNLTNVIEAMLDYIPAGEVNFRKAMERVMRDELYRAPEIQDWKRVTTLLMIYMKDFEDNHFGLQWKEDWCETVIRIWKDKI